MSECLKLNLNFIDTKAFIFCASLSMAVSNMCHAEVLPKCPAKIETNQTILSSPSDWIPVQNKSVHQFSRMTFKVKTDLGELGSDTESTKNGLTRLHWDFPAGEEIEQVCEYFGTSVKLRRKINEKSCDINAKSGSGTFVSVVCK